MQRLVAEIDGRRGNVIVSRDYSSERVGGFTNCWRNDALRFRPGRAETSSAGVEGPGLGIY